MKKQDIIRASCLSFHDLIGLLVPKAFGTEARESRSFDKLRMTELGACPGLDTGVKPDNDKTRFLDRL